MFILQEFELFKSEGYVLAFPFGLEGGTQGRTFDEAVYMAADWLMLTILDAMAYGYELPHTVLGNKPKHGGKVVAVAALAERMDRHAASLVVTRAYDAILTPEKEGGYSVEIPSLPGCFTCGDDYCDAAFMATDAARSWVSVALKHGDDMPDAYEIADAPDGCLHVCVAFDTYPE